ncbi:MAG: PH domain-containing protein [Alphaproteobacteria bacterium]
MGYVEKTLQPGEDIVYQTRVHWVIYLPAVLLILLGIAIAILAGSQGPDQDLLSWLGRGTLAVGFLLFVKAWITWISTEMAITSRRVIAKFGFIRRRTYEIDRSKVESVKVDQSILGRIFDYGTVTVTGTGSSSAPVKDVDSPLEFRGKLLAG